MWSNDPVADADRYERENEENAKMRPMCCECGCLITSDYAYHIKDDWYCEDCMENLKDAVYKTGTDDEFCEQMDRCREVVTD